jgi:hypothetical protein
MTTKFNNNPYLLLPGDRLTFFVSKYRPVKTNFYSDSYSRLAGECWRYNSGHDVQIPVGSLKVNVYGSYISDGKERHEPSPDSLMTSQIHKIIGDDPVDDQWEVWDDRELIGTFFDDVSVPWNNITITSYSNLKPPTTFQWNQKKRVTGLSFGVNPLLLDPNERGPFQILLSNSDPTNGYYSRDYTFGMNTYSSLLASDYHTQNYEIMGSNRVSPKQRHFCNEEVIYDSLVPNIHDFLGKDGVVANISSSFPNIGLYTLSKWNIQFPGCVVPSTYYSTLRSYPFEPRYADVKRSYSQTIYTAFSGVLVKEVDDISFEIVNSYENNPSALSRRQILLDYKFNSFNTIPAGSLVAPKKSDVTKFFYGFGDTLKSNSNPGNGDTMSLTTVPTFRYTDTAVLNNQNLDFVTSPLIRGWKYGLYSGLLSNTSCVFRRGHFGQFRDMLEQRPFTIFFDPNRKNVLDGPVKINFVDQDVNNLYYVISSNINSPNKSLFSTSSLPYFDGESRY